MFLNCIYQVYLRSSYLDANVWNIGCDNFDNFSNQFQRCILGYYSEAKSSFCTTCPAGSACPNTNGTAITLCDPGTYSFGQAIECTGCPAGSMCPEADGSGNAICVPVYFVDGTQYP